MIQSIPDRIDAAPRVLFLGLTYAGHRTRFTNLRAHTEGDPRIRPSYHSVTGWNQDGRIERLPLISMGAKGRARAVLESAPLAAFPRPDAIWTGVGEVATPHLWAQLGRLRRPMILDLDWTLEQQEAMAPLYFSRPPKSGPRLRLARLMERALWSRVDLFTPWSRWAADSLRRQGIPDERIRILPPGVDLEIWRPRPDLRLGDASQLRLLFVGGDFRRKGGDMLVDVVRTRFAGRCEVDIVTRDAVAPSPGVRVHRAEPNSPELRRLYAQADVFVLPTRAECFGIATVEAMAGGLPVIVGDVGGARDIVDDGRTGWLIEPQLDALAAALERALANRSSLPAMGARARRVAEERFDGQRNDRKIVDLLLELRERSRGGDENAMRSTSIKGETVQPAPGSRVSVAKPQAAPGSGSAAPVERLLLVLQSVAVGGMETHCVDLASEFKRRGTDVRVIVPEGAVFDGLAERFRAGGAGVARLNTDARAGRLSQIERWRTLVRLYRAFRPDVVHLHTGGATGGLAVIATARLTTRATVLITEHDVPTPEPGSAQHLARLALDRSAHAVVAVSRRNASLRRERLRLPERKFAAILNGVPTAVASLEERAANRRRVRKAWELGPESVVIGSVVRLAEGKGLDDLIRAFALLRRGPDCQLLLVGDGPLRKALEQLSADLGVSERVRFAGQQANPSEFVDAMDVFALAVPAGSMSIALLEAMGRGVPPVITFCGPEEAVIPDETGLSAPPTNPDGLAAALQRLVDDRNLRHRLGAAAENHVRHHFSVSRVADDLSSIYANPEAGVPCHLRADAPPNPRPGDRTESH